jgi:GNAT superfamily N-acetyltransferase
MTGLECARIVEFSEARAYGSLVERARAHDVQAFGLSVHALGHARAFVATGVKDSLMLNRVIGLGLDEPIGAHVLEHLDDLYGSRDIGAYAVEASPLASPDGLGPLLRRRGFMPFKLTTMLVRSTHALDEQRTDLEVRRVGSDAAASFAHLTCTVFGLQAPFTGLMEASFLQPGWQHWMAFDDGQPVASAMTALGDDGVAWIGWVGTLPSHRGRGAQSALTAAQVRAAHEAGARWITLEAATGSRRQPSQTLRNYLRLGWQSAYDRPIYLRRLSRAPEA